MTDLASMLSDLPGPDADAADQVAARARTVLRPEGALARLDEVASWLAGWQGSTAPRVTRPAATIFVADHGVAVEGVSAYPSEVTRSMLEALRDGAATAAVMARSIGAALAVVDVGVGEPTANLRTAPALGPDRFARSVEAGRKAVADLDADLLVIGEMGIGNTTAAAAVSATLFGGEVERWCGRGTGLDAEGLARKVAVVDDARRRVGAGAEPLEVLRQVGGAELAAIAGAVTEARRRSIPVVLDGYVATAAVAPLELVAAGALDHCLSAHRSPEPGHGLLLARLGKQPLLDLDLRLGEGSGALAAVPLVRLAAASVTDVATFEEWGLGPA